ncbi:MAG: beta-N-acetylhexosaminidase [bacterium]
MNAQAADLIGQHFMVDFSGPEITPDLERLVREGRIGAVILFDKNIRSIQQVRALTTDLQSLASEAGLPPLFISIDQEGGMVNRLVGGFTVFPGAMAIGATGRVEDAATAGRIASRELRALGINTNHAPVLDVNSNIDNPVIGVRAFSDDPAAVARMGIAYLKAAQEAGVLATPKHFPGHGATPVDSHLDLPVVTKDRLLLGREEVLPFAEAIKAGADGMLASHVVYPALDPARPATLSPEIITKLLRRELGFDGVAFTDSMDMKAISVRWTRGVAAVGALAAGMDVVLALGAAADQWTSIEAARHGAEDGTLDRSEMRASAARIARAKSRYTRPASSNDGVGTDAHRAEAQGIADRAVTLVRSAARRIPLPAGRTAVLHVGSDVWVGATPRLGAELVEMLPGAKIISGIQEVTEGSWDNVVVASLSWRSYQGVETIRALHKQFGERLVVVGAGNPYELLRFPEVDTYIAAYGPDPASMRAAARVLSGRLKPGGRLPVALPPLYARGHSA